MAKQTWKNYYYIFTVNNIVTPKMTYDVLDGKLNRTHSLGEQYQIY